MSTTVNRNVCHQWPKNMIKDLTFLSHSLTCSSTKCLVVDKVEQEEQTYIEMSRWVASSGRRHLKQWRTKLFHWIVLKSHLRHSRNRICDLLLLANDLNDPIERIGSRLGNFSNNFEFNATSGEFSEHVSWIGGFMGLLYSTNNKILVLHNENE